MKTDDYGRGEVVHHHVESVIHGRSGAVDHKSWAKRLQVRHQAGERLNANQIRCYRNALGLNVPAV